MWKEELEVSKNAAMAAGEEILRIYDNCVDMEVQYKDGDMPLTVADRAANKIIVELLRNYFKDYAILSEEETDNRERLLNDYCFIVDPLDGTKEFIKRNGQFTVNIALSYRGKSVIGVVYAPVTKELFYASESGGAFKIDSDGAVKKLQVSKIHEKSELRVVMSSSHGCKEMDDLIEKYELKNIVAMGSSLKGCLIAEGKAEIYYRFNPTMEWDTAAMECIVEEAGGVFKQMDGSEMRYNRENSVNEKGFFALNSDRNRIV